MTRPETAAGVAAEAARRSRTSLFVSYWLPVIAYLGLIFAASSIPGRNVPVLFPYMDKLEHLAEYSLFGLLLGRVFRFTVGGRRGRLWAFATVGFGAVVGALDELYQKLTPGRQSDIRDWAVDLAAVLLAVVLTQYVNVHPIGGRRGSAPGAAPAAGANAGSEEAAG